MKGKIRRTVVTVVSAVILFAVEYSFFYDFFSGRFTNIVEKGSKTHIQFFCRRSVAGI